MARRRDPGANWYQLTLEERSRLMYAHGLTGRRYAGRIQQTISGAIGLDEWEWGVTLVAKDPLDFKKIVTDMNQTEFETWTVAETDKKDLQIKIENKRGLAN